jgi:hypothetical protein
MSRSWHLSVRERHMTEEKQDEIYRQLIREYQEILTELAACRAELKRIGENFKTLGTDMIDRPESLAIDQVSFNADVAITPRLLTEYAELAAKRTSKRAELENFGPLPRSDAA